MGEFSPWHVIIVLLVFAVLFGSRKLPDAARGLGRSMRIFKAEMQSVQDEPAVADAPSTATPSTASVTSPTAVAESVAPVQDAVPPPTTA